VSGWKFKKKKFWLYAKIGLAHLTYESCEFEPSYND